MEILAAVASRLPTTERRDAVKLPAQRGVLHDRSLEDALAVIGGLA